MRLHACLALIVLSGCSTNPVTEPPARQLVIAYDDIFDGAAHDLELRYELDRPDIDVILDQHSHMADIELIQGDAGGVVLERRIAVIVPADSGLRLIDLSRGTCDVIIGRAGTPLGELGRTTLADRGLDDQINPRLLESDEDDLIDWAIERDAIGLTFLAQAAERRGDVRVVAEGAGEASSLVAMSAEGRAFVDWLLSGITTRTPLREHGFDVHVDELRPTPDSE